MSEVEFVPLSRRRALDVKQFTKDDNNQVSFNRSDEFYDVCRKAKEYLYEVYDRKVDMKSRNETEEDYVMIYHEAMRGRTDAVNLIKKHIESFISNSGLRECSYPEYYPSLLDGIFEEEFGWGPLSVFKNELECEGAQVLGTKIKFKRSWGYELLPFRFSSVEKVLELCDRFANMQANTNLNSYSKPELETSTIDGIRVSIMIPNRTYKDPVITLRRKTIKDYSFENLAIYRTFPFEAIPLLKSLSKIRVNAIIAGPPGSGKSTMLQAFMNEMFCEKRNGKIIPEPVNTIFAETHPEFDVEEIFPDANVTHVIGRGKDFEDSIGASVLRHDIVRVILGEIREHEVGLYKRSGVQGIKQVIGTLHDLDPIDIPDILTSLYLQYFDNNSTQASVYNTFARNLHYSLSMDEFLQFDDIGESVLNKKASSIQLYDFNSHTGELLMYKIMDYKHEEDSWVFSTSIPDRFERIASKYHRAEFETFKTVLAELEERWPMEKENTIESSGKKVEVFS